MTTEQEEYPFQPGDMVLARAAILSDGHVPDYVEGEPIASEGSRGMVVKVGHVEAQPDVTVYLVQFEVAPGELGPPVGCLRSELTAPQATH
jgi:nitrogen fixation protein NifZ